MQIMKIVCEYSSYREPLETPEYLGASQDSPTELVQYKIKN